MSSCCPCGSSKEYQLCCGRYIDTSLLPEAAETLMRSRYTAYTIGKYDYIQQTMCGKAAKQFDLASAESWGRKLNWLGLDILEHHTKQHTAIVLFVARYESKGKLHTLKEKSYFERQEGRWFYVDGEVFDIPVQSLPLNGPCYCQSGRKFKNCHFRPK